MYCSFILNSEAVQNEILLGNSPSSLILETATGGIVTDPQLLRWVFSVENFHDVRHYCIWITHSHHLVQ
jgi:hypothetical protein